MVLVKGRSAGAETGLLLNAHDDGGAACLQGKYDLNQTGDFLPLGLCPRIQTFLHAYIPGA